MTVRRKVLYNILVEFGIPVKLVKLIKMYLSEMYGKVHVSKCVSDTFPIHNCLKQGDAWLLLLFSFVLLYAMKKIQEN